MRYIIQTKALFFFMAALFLVTSCKKETDFIYGVTDVDIQKPDANKPNVKSTFTFISIAYSDLFGANISQNQLVDLQTAYAAFGDQRLIEQLIIKNFLNDSGIDIPTQSQMNANVEQFIKDSYVKFFNRLPNEFELWHIENEIAGDNTITPEHIYFAMMTSNEYRYY
jgi:hypothetical protein